MPTAANPPPGAAIAVPSAEFTTGTLIDTLSHHAGKPLAFVLEGCEVQPGYHVPEVKAGEFASLDCGANPESWRETIIQLWDVPGEPDRGFMSVGKFLAIMRKVAEKVQFDPAARLTFEVSDGSAPMQLFGTNAIEANGDTVRVFLASRPANCKPRDRWLEQSEVSQVDACCGSRTDKVACCG